jgi:hypothetical protein
MRREMAALPAGLATCQQPQGIVRGSGHRRARRFPSLQYLLVVLAGVSSPRLCSTYPQNFMITQNYDNCNYSGAHNLCCVRVHPNENTRASSSIP